MDFYKIQKIAPAFITAPVVKHPIKHVRLVSTSIKRSLIAIGREPQDVVSN